MEQEVFGLLDEFYSYLNNLLQLYAQLSEHLRKKLSTVTDGDVSVLEEIMKQEQAYILKTRSFDQKLEYFKEKAQLSGDTLGEIISNLPENEQQRFRTLHTELSAVLSLVKALSESCQSAISTQLHIIDKHLAAAGDNPDAAGYGKHRSSGAFHTSV